MKSKMQNLLATEVWRALTNKFGSAYGTDSPIYIFLDYYTGDFNTYVKVDFLDLMSIDLDENMPITTIADIAFMHMGDAFKRIFDVLTTEYNPLENFFTKGSFEKEGSIENSKEGTETTTPTGKIETSRKGQSYSENDGSFSVGQGSTYDSATTTVPTTTGNANDLYNISRNIQKNKVKNVLGDDNGTNLPTTTVEYKDNYKVEKSFEDRVDSTEYKDYKETTDKHGNSGIFSKQDLIQREVKMRLKNRIIPIYVRMVVDTFSSGVWSE